METKFFMSHFIHIEYRLDSDIIGGGKTTWACAHISGHNWWRQNQLERVLIYLATRTLSLKCGTPTARQIIDLAVRTLLLKRGSLTFKTRLREIQVFIID